MMLLRTLAAALGVTVASSAMADTVVLAMPKWASADVTAYVLGDLIEAHFGVTPKFRAIGSNEVFDAIDRGEVDVMPEVWLPNHAAFVAEYRDKRGSLTLSPKGVAASQSICTTAATVSETGLSSLSDLADPAMAKKFDTDGDGKGEMWIGAPDWSSTRVERVRAKSYGYDKTMMLLTGPEDGALAAVDAASAIGYPIVFYCYAPHHVFALHDIVVLKEPAHNAANWSLVAPEDDVAWLDKSSAGSAWEPSEFHIAYATDFANSYPEIAKFLDAVSLTTDDAAAMSYAINVERRTPEDVATTWIAANGARVEEWMR